MYFNSIANLYNMQTPVLTFVNQQQVDYYAKVGYGSLVRAVFEITIHVNLPTGHQIVPQFAWDLDLLLLHCGH